jgi:hypothetical protein
MRVLKLTLKKKWYNMIFSGNKLEEYREIKSYWIKRLLCELRSEYPYDIDTICEAIKGNYECSDLTYSFKHFDAIEFINGYSSNSPRFTIECKGINIGYGHNNIGAITGHKYFVIKLGKIIKS